MSIARNMRADGVALAPSGFTIKKCSMTRYDGGADIDITPLVVKINLIESLYAPTIVAQISLKDAANFMEEFPVCGHERVHLILERIEHDTEVEKRIELKFIVTEYPLYGKQEGGNANVQAYTLSAISEHAFLSSIKKISRQFNGQTDKEIIKILQEDLGHYNIRQLGTVITAAKGVLPRMKPLEACEWFRSRSCDNPESPIFLYQTIDGVIHLVSYSELIKEKVHGVYKDTRAFTQNPQSIEDYKERATRLLSVTSNLRFGRVFQSQSGAFASKMNYVDIATKTYGTKHYGYNIEKNTLTGNPPFSSAFKISDKGLGEYYDAHSNKVSLNTLAYGEQLNTNVLRKDYEQKVRSFTESLETMTHDIRIYGDYEFHPGKVITLKFPKALDPAEAELSTEDDHPGEDKLLSGKYLVTSAQHTFENGEYFINARVKRDSMGVEI